jgi:GxxExxY protein
MQIQDELTYKVIGCAMEVHKILGNGFQACLPKGSTARRQEVIYQRCLAIELQRAGIQFLREVEQPLFYKDEQVGTRRADFIIESKLVVELKAIIKLDDVNLSQAKKLFNSLQL